MGLHTISQTCHAAENPIRTFEEGILGIPIDPHFSNKYGKRLCKHLKTISLQQKGNISHLLSLFQALKPVFRTETLVKPSIDAK